MQKKISPALGRDIDYLADYFETEDELFNKSILITGATGLIGSLLAKTFMTVNQRYQANIKLILLIRNVPKAELLYSDYPDFPKSSTVVGDIIDLPDIPYPIDYIFHCASITTSSEMVAYPVETIKTITDGTNNILDLAHRKKVKSMVYLSSMEVYGQVENSLTRTKENELGYIDLSSSRSSYPEGKRLAECLCHAFWKEFGVPVKIARLAQTFGPGILKSDNRVFAQFAKSVINGQDIILHTEGNSIGNYCYTTDCIKALLTLLLKGENGEAYNIVNEESSMSIREVAKLIVEEIADNTIQLRYEIPQNTCYAADTYLKLDAARIDSLGWHPSIGLKESYIRLIEYLEEIS